MKDYLKTMRPQGIQQQLQEADVPNKAYGVFLLIKNDFSKVTTYLDISKDLFVSETGDNGTNGNRLEIRLKENDIGDKKYSSYALVLVNEKGDEIKTYGGPLDDVYISTVNFELDKNGKLQKKSFEQQVEESFEHHPVSVADWGLTLQETGNNKAFFKIEKPKEILTFEESDGILTLEESEGKLTYKFCTYNGNDHNKHTEYDGHRHAGS